MTREQQAARIAESEERMAATKKEEIQNEFNRAMRMSGQYDYGKK